MYTLGTLGIGILKSPMPDLLSGLPGVEAVRKTLASFYLQGIKGRSRNSWRSASPKGNYKKDSGMQGVDCSIVLIRSPEE